MEYVYIVTVHPFWAAEIPVDDVGELLPVWIW
jgi:hypothetical protein